MFCYNFSLLDAGRFEILTGGWVMTDEAVTHYYSMLDQLMEGQQWLMQHLSTFKSINNNLKN